MVQQSPYSITSMLQQKTTFPIVVPQQSMQNNFNVTAEHLLQSGLVQQSVRIASMFQQEITFTIMIVQLLVQITSMLLQEKLL